MGARAHEPVEQPVKFDLVIILKVAKAVFGTHADSRCRHARELHFSRDIGISKARFLPPQASGQVSARNWRPGSPPSVLFSEQKVLHREGVEFATLFVFCEREVWKQWKASSVMEKRLRFVARLLDGEAMTDVCRDFGVSRKTGYKIFDRYKERGLEALSDRLRVVGAWRADCGAFVE